MTRRPPPGPPYPAQTTRALALAAVFLMTSACTVSTPPIRYLQLSSASAPSGSQDTPVILIEAIDLPDYLLRDELARRIDDVTLRYDPYQRWAEPLDLAVQRVLAEHLGALLDTRQVVRYPDAPRSTPDWVLRMRLLRLERETSRAVLHGEASWARAGARGTTVHSVTVEETQPLRHGASGADAVRALNGLLERFARAMADALQVNGTTPTPTL